MSRVKRAVLAGLLMAAVLMPWSASASPQPRTAIVASTNAATVEAERKALLVAAAAVRSQWPQSFASIIDRRGHHITGSFRVTRTFARICGACGLYQIDPPSVSFTEGGRLEFVGPAPRMSPLSALSWMRRNFVSPLGFHPISRTIEANDTAGANSAWLDVINPDGVRITLDYERVSRWASINFYIEHDSNMLRRDREIEAAARRSGSQVVTAPSPPASVSQAGASANRSEREVPTSRFLRLTCSPEPFNKFIIDFYLGTVAVSGEYGPLNDGPITEATPSQVVWEVKDSFGITQFTLNRQTLQLQAADTGGDYYTEECSAS